VIEARLESLGAFLLDLDGVVYRGDVRLPGAAAFIAELQAVGIPFLFVTNNSTRTPAQFAAKLARMGIRVDERLLLTSALATSAYLTTVAPPGTKVYVIGEIGLRRSLTERGFVATDDWRAARYVVVGHDTSLTWHKLADATLAVGLGATFIGTNPDSTLPTEEGLVPGAGAILAALKVASGQAPLVIGKPESIIFEQALAILGTRREVTAMIGDRLDTDIRGAQRAGLRTIGVRSGVTSQDGFLRSDPLPDWIFDDLAGLLTAWRAPR
jgi:4-nitrophenyl phosphatase